MLPDRVEQSANLTSTSKPCGHRFSGDLPGFKGALPEQEMRNLRISAEGLKQALRDSWSASLRATDLPLDEMERLVKEKYLNPSWTYN